MDNGVPYCKSFCVNFELISVKIKNQTIEVRENWCKIKGRKEEEEEEEEE